MKVEKERKGTFTRRALLLGASQGAVFSVLAGRMYYLQIIEGDKYKFLAEENRINVQLIGPKRGHIVDRFGKVLAKNIPNYRVLFTAERVKNVQDAMDILSHYVPLSEEQRESIVSETKKHRSFVPVLAVENLTWPQVASIEANSHKLAGFNIDIGQKRIYPYSGVAGPVTGYVASPSEKDLDGDPLLELPDFHIGKSGLEKNYEKILRGKAGARHVEVNAHGRIIRELSRQDGYSGKDLVSSIDIELQQYAADILGDESASVVVMDIHNGEVLCLVSNPSYDPNIFVDGLSHQEWRDLSSNPRSPLKNKAVGGQYAPGSTYKMIVAMAGLEAGVITPRDSFSCPGYKYFGGRRFHCWKRGGHGRVNLNYGIKQSCDVYFYEVALKVGVDKIAEMANKFGLGVINNIDIPDEKKGTIPTKEWKRKMFKEPWYKGETLSIGIGQGYVTATPLQLAVMTARLANGGYEVKPTLVKTNNSPLFKKIDITEENLKKVLDGMVAVTSPGGTAYRSRIDLPDMAMAGKTGTAQVKRITAADRASGRYKNRHLPWHLRDHALFVGYAPIHSPRYAVSVIVEHGGGGSAAAAPVAKEVMIKVQQRMKQKDSPVFPNRA